MLRSSARSREEPTCRCRSWGAAALSVSRNRARNPACTRALESMAIQGNRSGADPSTASLTSESVPQSPGVHVPRNAKIAVHPQSTRLATCKQRKLHYCRGHGQQWYGHQQQRNHCGCRGSSSGSNVQVRPRHEPTLPHTHRHSRGWRDFSSAGLSVAVD